MQSRQTDSKVFSYRVDKSHYVWGVVRPLGQLWLSQFRHPAFAEMLRPNAMKYPPWCFVIWIMRSRFSSQELLDHSHCYCKRFDMFTQIFPALPKRIFVGRQVTSTRNKWPTHTTSPGCSEVWGLELSGCTRRVGWTQWMVHEPRGFPWFPWRPYETSFFEGG